MAVWKPSPVPTSTPARRRAAQRRHHGGDQAGLGGHLPVWDPDRCIKVRLADSGQGAQKPARGTVRNCPAPGPGGPGLAYTLRIRSSGDSGPTGGGTAMACPCPYTPSDRDDLG